MNIELAFNLRGILMAIGAAGGYSNAQKINQMIKNMAQVQKSNQTQVVRQLEATDSKISKASYQVMNNAVQTKSQAVSTKGRIIDTMV